MNNSNFNSKHNLFPPFRQAEVHSVGNKNPPKEVQPDEENESESTNSPQQHKMPPLLLNRKSHNEQILEVNQNEEANTNSRSDLPRSESIRSNLTLNLGNSSQSGQPNKVRSRPTITTSRTTPSLSMISSLISLESFRANKEKRQQSGNTFSANVQAQVRTVHVYKSYLWNFLHFSFHFLFLWLPYIRHTIQRNPIFLNFIWRVWLHLLYPLLGSLWPPDATVQSMSKWRLRHQRRRHFKYRRQIGFNPI